MEHQIKQILKQKGMTQKQLAEKLNMSIQQINNTVSGRNTASMSVFERIAEALDVEFWQLFAPDGIGKVADTSSAPHIICPKCGEVIPIETVIVPKQD